MSQNQDGRTEENSDERKSDTIRLFVSVMIESLEILRDRPRDMSGDSPNSLGAISGDLDTGSLQCTHTLSNRFCSEGRETLSPADMKKIYAYSYILEFLIEEKERVHFVGFYWNNERVLADHFLLHALPFRPGTCSLIDEDGGDCIHS